MTGAPEAVRNAVETLGLQYNAMVKQYPAGSSGAPAEMNEQDARELAMHLRQVAELIRDAETERILTRLRHPDGVLPEDEVIEARCHQGWFIPHLIREFRDEVAELRKLDSLEEHLAGEERGSIPFFSLFLFSEWHVAESVPVVLESLRLPGEGPFILFGDAVHEVVPRYSAQFLSEQLDQIDTIIHDAEADAFVRWSAASSYKYLVRDQKLFVEDAVTRLERLFLATTVVAEDGSAAAGHCYELSSGIMDVIHSIGGSSRSMFSGHDDIWKFVDESIIDREEFDEPSMSTSVWQPTKELLRLPPTRIEDCLEELGTWAAFRPRPEPVPPPPAPSPRIVPHPPLPDGRSPACLQ